MKIEVIDADGTSCKMLLGNILEVLRESGRKGKVVIIKDLRKIMKYGASATPALVINGMVIFSGRLGSPDEIMKLLQRHLSPLV